MIFRFLSSLLFLLQFCDVRAELYLKNVFGAWPGCIFVLFFCVKNFLLMLVILMMKIADFTQHYISEMQILELPVSPASQVVKPLFVNFALDIVAYNAIKVPCFDIWRNS